MVIYMEVTIAYMQRVMPEAVKGLVGVVRETETGVKYLVETSREEIYKQILERK